MKYQPSTRVRQYLDKVMACGHWRDAEKMQGTHAAWIRHTASGDEINYPVHDGGNDWNGPRNFAQAASAICGCKFIEPRSRKRSRKAIRNPLEERRAEAAVQSEINDLIAEERELREAIARAMTACFNSRSMRSQRFLDNLRSSRATVAGRLDYLYPEWSNAS